MIVAGGLAGLLSAQRGFSPIVTLALLISGGIAGHVFNDWRLSQAIKSHEARVLAEFPTVAELLALSITAGEGIVEALERVCRTCSGDLVDELRAALSATRTGTPLVEALDGIDRKSTRLNSSHVAISYAVFCLKKKKKTHGRQNTQQ